MLNLNHPMRMKREPGFKVTYITTKPSREHQGREMMFILITDRTNGQAHVAYRNPDGTHSQSMGHLDLVNFDISAVASLYQTMDSGMAKAIATLWRHDQFGPALDVMRGIDPTLNVEDIRHYFEGLFG